MNNSTTNFSEDRSHFTYWVTRPNFQIILTIIALIVIILYGAFNYLYYPYSGMEVYWSNDFGWISEVYPDGPADQAGVLEGDRLLSIDGKPLRQWSNGPAYRSGIRSGDTVVFEFQRGQERLRIPITIRDYFENLNWYWYSFLIHFLAISFWAMGAAMCLFSPHNDERSRLLGLGFLMAGMNAAVVLASGWSSFWGANSLGIILWIWLGPIYVAAHLTFPVVSLPKYRRQIINFFVIIAIILTTFVLMSAWSLNPVELSVFDLVNLDLRRSALIFFFFSWSMGTGLLVYNRICSPDSEVRRQTGVVLWGSVLGFSPFFVFVVLPELLFKDRYTGSLSVLAFLLLVPLSYIYVIHQHRLLRVDFVINRFVVVFVLILFIFSGSMMILGTLALVLGFSPSLAMIGGAVAVLIALPSATLQQKVQVRVNRVLYGDHYDFSTVTSHFSDRLAVTLDRNTLLDLLTKDLSLQMGIQQSALFLADGKNLVLQPTDKEGVSLPLEDDVCQCLLNARNPVWGQYLWNSIPEASLQYWQEYDWGELFIPMVFEGKLQGILVLGERVAADLYSETDVQIIATIAYQGALVYANVQLVETLRGLTQQLVRADEDQRRKVARDLHDAVLQDLFFVRQKLSSEQGELADHIGQIINQLRQMIKVQRTGLLDQGIELALESLVVDMQSRSGDSPQILWSNRLNGRLKLTDEQATSIYRIVQEAISNALKHAQAEYIHVKMEDCSADGLVISIEDDGMGISQSEPGVLVGQHYGLVGMKERALMIGADLSITSDIGRGTAVTLQICVQ